MDYSELEKELDKVFNQCQDVPRYIYVDGERHEILSKNIKWQQDLFSPKGLTFLFPTLGTKKK